MSLSFPLNVGECPKCRGSLSIMKPIKWEKYAGYGDVMYELAEIELQCTGCGWRPGRSPTVAYFEVKE